MPRQTRGTTYPVKGGIGIRWQHDGTRGRNPGPFRNKTEAHSWFDEHIAPRLRHGGPAPEISLKNFTGIYLERWGTDVAPRTRQTLIEWVAPVEARFGTWTLSELEGAVDDIARWRAMLPTAYIRFTATRAMRQVLAAAVRWGYMARNPAVDMGPNPQPRGDEIQPFTRAELDAILAELADSPRDVAIVTFAVKTGLRTNEWTATEWRDIDRVQPAVAVSRRYSEGVLTPYPKTERRRVPLTPAVQDAIGLLVPGIGQTPVFPGDKGGSLNLNNWRNRIWYPALEAAGLERRGPYQLRHTFASEALHHGVSIYELRRLMGASIEMIERHYGHLVRESEDKLRELLSNS